MKRGSLVIHWSELNLQSVVGTSRFLMIKVFLNRSFLFVVNCCIIKNLLSSTSAEKQVLGCKDDLGLINCLISAIPV